MRKFLIPIMFFSSFAWSQVTDNGIIYSKNHQLKAETPMITMPAFDLESLKAEDAIEDGKWTKPYRFGNEFDVNIDPKTDGKWTILENGDRIWQIEIASKDARTLNFLLGNYNLSPHAKIYIHNENQQFLGYYTANENNKTQEVNTWLIDGEKATIEFYEPKAEIGQSTFKITKVVHGYRSVKNIEDHIKALNTSGHCNVDVNCAAGNDWEIQKRSVGMIMSGSSGFCSGTLINNTANDGTPYFLTANHCLGGNVNNWAFRFKWISENPDCGTTAPSGDGPRTFSMSGATVVAKNPSSDFALLKLNNEIPIEWDLVLAGWDKSGEIPNNVTSLHHPDADIMKIAQYYSSPTKSTRYGIANWEIADWDLGMTEGGSSGSGLFDHNGRLIGQLYGGEAACSGVNTNGRWDNYGRLDVSWEGGGTPQTRLKDWLDPTGSGASNTDHFSYQTYDYDLQLLNLTTSVNCEGEVSSNVVIINRGENTVNNFNIVYNFDDDEEISLPWNGTLTKNQNVTVAIPPVPREPGEGKFTAKIEFDLDELEDNNVRSNNYEIFDTYSTQKVKLSLTTDNYARETSWKIFDENDNVIAQNGTLQNATTHIVEIDLPTEGCYRLEMYDSYGDGFCCSYGNGSYTLETESGEIIKQGGSFEFADITNFKITNNLATDQWSKQNFDIYPNPTNDEITLDVDAKFGTYQYEIFSIAGQKLGYGKAKGKTNLYMKSYGKGVYMINIQTENGKTISKKIMVK